MRRYGIVFAIGVLAAAPAAAASLFDGTWKVDLKTTQIMAKPDVILLKDGVYSCSSCTPPYAMNADGAFHPIAGRDYIDALKIDVVDARTIVRTGSLHAWSPARRP